MSDPRDGLGQFFLCSQVLVLRVPDLTDVLEEWSDINAESFDEKVLVPRGE